MFTSNYEVDVRKNPFGLHELPGMSGMEHVVDAVCVDPYRSVGCKRKMSSISERQQLNLTAMFNDSDDNHRSREINDENKSNIS